ncbi:hypothetical protein BGZ52_005101, partial [Haplosporangium bisporale]
MYDTVLKRFLALDQGLDGPVQDLVCDDSTGQVFVVGGFRAPVPDMTSAAAAGGDEGVTTKEYEALGVFGGGVAVSTGNGLHTSQDRNIICQPATATRGNWIMRNNIPGYWRAQFPLYLSPTLFRLWNVDTTAGPEAMNRGTRTFSIMAQPQNQLLNLSYIDTATNSIQYCTVCPLQQRTSAKSATTTNNNDNSGFQDFVVDTPVLLNAIQVDVVSWYGLGGGLGGIEVYQSEIFARAVSEMNFSSQCAISGGIKVSAASAGTGAQGGDYDMTAYSSSMGDWTTMKMPDGWQTVLATSVSATNEAVRKPAYVDLAPYLQESGINIVAWNGNKLVPLGGGAIGGVDGVVSSIVLEGQSTLYVVGAFNQALGTAPILLPGGFASYSIESQKWTSLGNVSEVFLPGAQFQSVEISVGDAGQPQLAVTGKFSWANGAALSTAPSTSGMASVAIWDISSGAWIQETEPALASQGQRFEFGYVHGQISYLNRIMGSVSTSGSGNATTTQPVVLVAGMIDSLDTYQASQPENMAWLNTAGGLRTMNLVPSIPIPGSTVNDTPATNPIANSPVLPTTNAGIMYLNRTSEAWITIVGGSHVDGSIGAGYFYSPPVSSADQDSTMSFKELNLKGSAAVGEIFALGLSKSEVDGQSSTEAGSDLLLLGGAFKSPSTSGANTNGLVIYDLSSDQLVTGFTGLRGASGRGDPVVNVIKNKPGQQILVIAGDFAGVGKETICEGVCLWDPVLARQALDKRKSLEGSFKSLYGDNGGKTNMGVLKGVVNDIAFEDDKNMFVAGDLIVNGVACGVASFNFDNTKWTTFGSMVTAAQLSGPTGASHPPGPDTLMGP